MELEKEIESRLRIENEHKSGASWFYWIAGMSVLNEIFFLTHSGWNFAIGLGITQVISAFSAALFGGSIVLSVINLLIVGAFVLLGKMADRGHLWAYVTGIIIYSFDAIIFIIIKDYIGLGLHAFALFFIYRGMRAYRQLTEMKNNQSLKASEEGISI
jgi:hypothetical protein